MRDRYSGTWGHQAEDEFMSRYPKALRYGLDRPELNWGVQRLSLFERYTPDFIMSSPALVEVQGFGKNGLRIKLEKLRALDRWHEIASPVWFWLYSSARNDELWMPLDAAWELIDRQLVAHENYSDTTRGKAVIRIRPSDLPWGKYDAP